MTRKEFEEIKDEHGYDWAMEDLYQKTDNDKFYSYPALKDEVIELVKMNCISSAFDILKVVNNPPELDCGFYYYDKNSGEPPVNLDNEDLIEKYIGFDKE